MSGAGGSFPGLLRGAGLLGLRLGIFGRLDPAAGAVLGDVGQIQRGARGLGLGLSICQSLARQVNSEIRLAKTGPTGSCFELIVRNCR